MRNLNAHLSVFVPLEFLQAESYLSEILTRHGFSPINPYMKTVYAIIHTDDGLGESVQLAAEEVKQRVYRGEVRAVQYWSGGDDILVGCSVRARGWNFSISTVSWKKEGFDRIAKELFSDTLERFYCDVDDKPTIELMFD